MYEKFGQFYNGEWHQSSDKGTYEVINPANEEILGHASKATSLDVEAALQSAAKGLDVCIKKIKKPIIIICWNNKVNTLYFFGCFLELIRNKKINKVNTNNQSSKLPS